MSKTSYVIDGSFELYRNTILEDARIVVSEAVLPPASRRDWENAIITILDWRFPSDGIVQVEYMVNRTGLQEPIHVTDFEFRKTSIPMRPPSKSRAWKLSPISHAWINSKTGERVPV